jgi:hypothetical protein
MEESLRIGEWHRWNSLRPGIVRPLTDHTDNRSRPNGGREPEGVVAAAHKYDAGTLEFVEPIGGTDPSTYFLGFERREESPSCTRGHSRKYL